jgi:ribosomal protein S12 methylthiotransferase
LEVIVDKPDPEVPGHFLARSHADAPDIDCVVRLKGKGLRTGDLVRARVTGADGYDLAARALRVR